MLKKDSQSLPPIPPDFKEVQFFNSVTSAGVTLFVPTKAWKIFQAEQLKKAQERKAEKDTSAQDTSAQSALEEAAEYAAAVARAERAEVERCKKEVRDAELREKGIDPDDFDRLMADKLPVHPRLHLQVYDPLAPLVLRQKVKTTDKDLANRNKELFNTLANLGSYRRIVEPPIELDALFHLEADYPHFREVVQFVRRQIVLARSLGKGVHIPPILLGGGPGLGKTHFTQALARALGLPCRRQGMDAAVTGSSFIGVEKKWSNATPGFLFNMICTGMAGEVPIANPVVLLDELDKCTQHYDSPISPLHGLLEPVSASRVRDQSLEIEFDCSRVVWIATANLLPRIPDSLRSRFREFWIELPMGQEAIQFAQGVVRETVKRLGNGEFAAPERAIGVQLAHLTAREIYQAVEDALARATENGRTVLTVRDLPIDALCEDPEPKPTYLN